MVAEKATIELINKFVSQIEIGLFNRKGKRQFQLPKSEITEQNWRAEEWLPIDKFDWLSFEKINRPVLIFPDTEKPVLCKFKAMSTFDFCFVSLPNCYHHNKYCGL